MKEQDFLDNGFIKDTKDPMFKFRKELIEDIDIERLNLSFDEIPALLYGTTTVNRGFCIYTGSHFVFLNFDNVKEAVSFSEKIVAFEQV
ncbi:hypothetical protein [Tenacibaculum finnmarkense]|uniref:hypothetical protein n=1 Tax=Tenacibaculum finnmarkense TaxID=2781243 RepID=UPI00207A1711|nr:hypothetical protein [Tenacibaculum finnmarkense]MCM8906800.1 hypothetical protein [Tenacibaculum finnmarkense genomovar finnmarkense]